MSADDYGAEYQFKSGARSNIRQYRMLVRCAEAGDVTEWNEWRRGHPNEEVWLCGIDLAKASLNKVNLGGSHLEGAVLASAKLEDAILCDAHLDGAVLWQAHLNGANLWKARMKGAKLWRARLEKAALLHACLENAILTEANLQRADLSNAGLEGAVLAQARLEGTRFNDSRLQGADFRFALIDGATRIDDCEVDRDTDFRGVGLDAGRVEPGLNQLLKYNIRRQRWREWYNLGPRWMRALKWGVVGSFWWISDYGHSTVRVALACTFLILAFATAYYCNPDWLQGLNSSGGFISGIHAVYFSVVTMMTLGFGDVHARADIWQGQVLVILQVVSGYALLGALVTRLSVLFTAGGPSAHFSKRKRSDEEPPT